MRWQFDNPSVRILSDKCLGRFGIWALWDMDLSELIAVDKQRQVNLAS